MVAHPENGENEVNISLNRPGLFSWYYYTNPTSGSSCNTRSPLLPVAAERGTPHGASNLGSSPFQLEAPSATSNTTDTKQHSPSLPALISEHFIDVTSIFVAWVATNIMLDFNSLPLPRGNPSPHLRYLPTNEDTNKHPRTMHPLRTRPKLATCTFPFPLPTYVPSMSSHRRVHHCGSILVRCVSLPDCTRASFLHGLPVLHLGNGYVGTYVCQSGGYGDCLCSWVNCCFIGAETLGMGHGE